MKGLDEPEKGRKGKAKFPGNYLLGKLAVPQERNQWAFRTLLLKAAGYTQEAVEKWSSGGEKYEEGEIGSLWEQEPEETEDEALASLNRLVVADARAAGDYVLEDREVLDDLAVVRTAMANRGADRDGEGAPKLFTTGGAVSRLANGGILQLEHLSLLDELGAQADWLRINGLGQMGKGTPCADALKIAVSADSARVGLPELNSIVHQPVVLPDGGGYTVVDMPGYREKAGVLSRVSGIEPMELETAKAWLNDAFGFFETGANRPKREDRIQVHRWPSGFKRGRLFIHSAATTRRSADYCSNVRRHQTYADYWSHNFPAGCGVSKHWTGNARDNLGAKCGRIGESHRSAVARRYLNHILRQCSRACPLLVGVYANLRRVWRYPKAWFVQNDIHSGASGADDVSKQDWN